MNADSNPIFVDEQTSPPETAGQLPFSTEVYTSRERHQTELSGVFGRSWVHVADTTELQNPGDYVAGVIGNTPVLIIRSHDGELRGFLNACRHRGATLVEDRGHCEHQLRCPYHAWSYATDGRLVGVPFRSEFDLSGDMNLVPIRIGVAAPLVFGCLDRNAPSLERWLGGLGPALDRARGAEMTPIGLYEYDVAANWKVAVENALDTYHLPTVHPAGEGALINLETTQYEIEEFGSYAAAKLPGDLAAILPPFDHLPQWDREHARMGSLFPNLVAVLMPGVLFYFRYDPLDVDRIRLQMRVFERGDSPPPVREIRTSMLDIINKEDIPILERVQRGMRAQGMPPFMFARRFERRVHHFQTMVNRALADAGSVLRDLKR